MASTKPDGDKPKNGKASEFQEDPPRATDTNGNGNNSAARAKALDAAIERFCDLQAEEDALLEKYITPIRDKKNTVKSDLKRDFEIPTKAFNARAALRLIEKANQDDVVLAVNELFQATPVGHNLDLIAIAERVEKKKAEKAAAKAKSQTEVKATEQQL